MDYKDKIRQTKILINTKILLGESRVTAMQEWGNLILELHEDSIQRAETFMKESLTNHL